MLTKINEVFFGQQKRSGQIAVILILFIAILLAIFAVIMNIGKTSQTRTFLTVAVDTSASLMSSMFASYAESNFQSVIEPGKNDESDWPITRREMSDFLTYLVSAVIAIVGLILLVLGAVTYGTTSLASVYVFAIAGVVLAVAGLILYVCWVQPEQQNAWNKMFKNLTIQEKFLEQGVQTLLSYAAQDPALVEDDSDYDMDGQIYDSVNNAEEKVGRFSVLYTRRAEYLGGNIITDPTLVPNFLKALAEFLYDQQAPAGANPKVFSWDPAWDITPDGFGVWDKEGGGAPVQGTYFHNESRTNCTVTNPSGCPANGSAWPIIGDPLWENPQNSFLSFRELVGRDDENKAIYFNYNVNSAQNPIAASATAQAMPWAEWQPTDAMGLYNLLWKLDKTKTSLLSAIPSTHEGCFWCGSSGTQSWSSCPAFFTGFTLPHPEACSSSNPQYGSAGLRNCWCLAPNTDPADLTPSIMPDNACFDPYSNVFSWKKGVNNYCSTNIPYKVCATKNCPTDCSNYIGGNGCCVTTANPWCEEHEECFPHFSCGVDDDTGDPIANETTWRDDLLDLLRYDEEVGLNPFIAASKDLLAANPSSVSLSAGSSFANFHKWIKIGTSQQDMGYLQAWVSGLDIAKQELTTLQNKIFAVSSQVICPNTSSDPSVTPTEIKDCLNSTISSIQTCMNDCTNNITLCQQLATRLGITFAEPPPTSGTFNGQSTGCSVFTANYVFMNELSNWSAKLTHRKNYLFGVNNSSGLYAQIQTAIAAADLAKAKINQFLNDPRVDAMRTAVAASNSSTTATPGKVIYAWQDEAKTPPEDHQGKWHVVLAQAGVPTLCNGKCGRRSCARYSPCPEPYLPKVKEWSHKIGFNQWWSLVDLESGDDSCKGDCGDCNGESSYNNKESYKSISKCFVGGMTKARIVRYDEAGGSMSWATGLNFWNTRSENINATSSAGSPNDIDGPGGKCQNIMNLGAHGALPDGGASYGVPGAFILNARTNYNAQCYDLMLNLLRRGVQAESCAEYFCRQGNESYQSSRFAVKFVPCRSNDW